MSLNFGGINIGGISGGGGGGGDYLNVNASNLSSAGKKVFDGQWTTGQHAYLANVDLTNTTGATVKRDIDMSDYLPDDGYTYEVYFSWWQNATAPENAGQVNQITCAFDHNIVGENKIFAYLGRASLYKISSSANFTMPNISGTTLIVSPERLIRLVTYNNSKGNIADLSQVAYRRIGTNQ